MLERKQIERLFYGEPEHQRRFTQDFPVLPDVWIEYGAAAAPRVKLLLTPHNESDAATVAKTLRDRLQRDRTAGDGRQWRAAHADATLPRVLFNESVVFAELSFWEMLRGALPLTNWWDRVVAPIGDDWGRAALRDVAHRLNAFAPGQGTFVRGSDPKLLQKLIQIVVVIERDRRHLPPPPPAGQDGLSDDDIEIFADTFERLGPVAPQECGLVWSVSLNRKAHTSIWRSRLTVKADAAGRLFEAKTTGIRWAVLDTGIDATHPAFARRNASGEPATPDRPNPADTLNSRVIKTYDFLKIKDLLDPDRELEEKDLVTLGALRPVREELRRSLQSGRSIDWTLLEPLLRIPHTDAYQPPRVDSHGTHVAGILAANWPEAPTSTSLQDPLYGVCPDLELYDLRVLPDDPEDDADEFTIIAALQFVRHVNAHKDLMVIHGVNLSLSVPHDVANYACGRTPVCEECERVVASGVVVVTAAGNRGFSKRDGEGDAFGDYRYISITDPGNAEEVITVGSTHRQLPHSYGVSYFSSRGPTGDGRTKPDLVAPGERIDSCSLNKYFATMDGTSMAAPHVSGAAALLLARHRELVGQPRRVKEILCKSATDLGREPRFQGAGLVDVLRALQSV